MNDNELRNIQNTPLYHRKIIDEYCGYVHSIIYSKLKNIASSEDIDECVSDVFLKFFMNYNSEKEINSDIKAYISAIAKRTAINMYKKLSVKNNRNVSIEEDYISELVSDTDVQADTEKKEMRNILLKKLDELGEPDSTILIQSYYYNKTAKEIGKIVSMNTSAVLMRKKRALDKLKKLLSNTGFDF